MAGPVPAIRVSAGKKDVDARMGVAWASNGASQGRA